jgi:hypothetical protein
VDKNLFTAEPTASASLGSGADADSISGDPMFVDPAAGDFRVKDGSPAFKIGFKNFPMDQFGVKKPALKAIARTPGDSRPAPGRRSGDESAQGKAGPMARCHAARPARRGVLRLRREQGGRRRATRQGRIINP